MLAGYAAANAVVEKERAERLGAPHPGAGAGNGARSGSELGETTRPAWCPTKTMLNHKQAVNQHKPGTEARSAAGCKRLSEGGLSMLIKTYSEITRTASRPLRPVIWLRCADNRRGQCPTECVPARRRANHKPPTPHEPYSPPPPGQRRRQGLPESAQLTPHSR